MIWIMIYALVGVMTSMLGCDDEDSSWRRQLLAIIFWPIVWIMVAGMMIKKEK